jgi:hypothetical protein
MGGLLTGIPWLRNAAAAPQGSRLATVPPSFLPAGAPERSFVRGSKLSIPNAR